VVSSAKGIRRRIWLQNRKERAMSQVTVVAVALLIATLCTATATAVHVGSAGLTARASAADEARVDLQRHATELHNMALRSERQG
jgi:hypothetical protein